MYNSLRVFNWNFSKSKKELFTISERDLEDETNNGSVLHFSLDLDDNTDSLSEMYMRDHLIYNQACESRLSMSGMVACAADEIEG